MGSQRKQLSRRWLVILLVLAIGSVALNIELRSVIRSRFIGEWKESSYPTMPVRPERVLDVRSNGTYQVGGEIGRWSATGHQLILLPEREGEPWRLKLERDPGWPDRLSDGITDGTTFIRKEK
jgi:hypothetical protein